MANRRMFSLKVVDTDAFLDMGQGSQLLYFHLAMRADDDGFVNSPKKIMRFAGAKDDDFKILIAKDFIIPFQSGVIVIRHWKENNDIRKDRYKETIYKEEKAQIKEDINKVYQMATNGIPNVNQMDTQVRLGEVRLGKVRIDKRENTCENKFSREVAEIIKKFKEINPSLSYGNKTQRKAIIEMIEYFSYKKVLTIVDKIISVQGEKYAPRATTPYAMWTKIGDFKAYFDAEQKTQIKNIIPRI